MARDYGIYPKYVVRPGGVTFRSKSAAIRKARDGGASYVENLDTGRVVWERRKKYNPSKRKVRRRVAKALKKYVRGNASKRRKTRRLIEAEGRYDKSAKTRYPSRPDPRAYAELLAAQADQYDAWGRRKNPPRVKGRKTKGGIAVTLKNFSGTIVKKSDGTVQIVGRGRRK